MASAEEMLAKCRQCEPSVKFALNSHRNAIGAWNSGLGRFCRVMMLTVDERWLMAGPELLVNGKPMDVANGTVWVEDPK